MVTYEEYKSFGEDVTFYVIRKLPLTQSGMEEMVKAPRVKIDYELLRDENNEEEVIKVLRALSPTTFSLDLSYAELPFSRLQRVIETALAITTLTTLDLHMNKINGDGAIKLASLLEKNTTLTMLDLTWNGSSKLDAAAYANALSKNITLRHLALLLFPTSSDKEIVLAFNDILETNISLESITYNSIHDTRLRRAFGSGIAGEIVAKLTMNKTMREHPEYGIPPGIGTAEEILHFCQMLSQGYEEVSTIKLVVLGKGQIGKSTLVNSLKHCSKGNIKRLFSKLSSGHPSRFATSSTVGIGHHSIKVNNGEIIIWDFAGQLEYTVTHQYFLSSELVVYLVCFDLAEDHLGQIDQITYWLDYLHSLLGTPQSVSKWKVVLVGTRSDLDKSNQSLLSSNPVPVWQQTWPLLPLYNEVLCTSRYDNPSVDKLLELVKRECQSLMSTKLVPKSYLCILKYLQQQHRPIIHVKDVQEEIFKDDFMLALEYFHSVGSIVLVDDLICTDPAAISQLMSNFISPEAVQLSLPHIANKKVEILTSQQVGKVMMVKEDDPHVYDDLKLMSHFGICFPLPTASDQPP